VVLGAAGFDDEAASDEPLEGDALLEPDEDDSLDSEAGFEADVLDVLDELDE